MHLAKLKIALPAALFIIAVLTSAFSSKTAYTPSPVVIWSYIEDVNKAFITLDETAEAYRKGGVGTTALQTALTNARLSYKKAEFYLAFHYPEYATEHFNGAPLLHIEKSGTEPLVLPPEGLQVLDELIFSEDPSAEKVAIAALAKKARNYYNVLYSNLKSSLPTGGITTAMRMQLVRIFTLGLTGFDTPGSLNAINEAKASLRGMQAFLETQYNKEEIPGINALFAGALAYLDNSGSFEEFDRLYFLTTYLDPLYKQLGKLEKGTGSEFLQNTTAWNAASESMFSNNFLNPYFFSDLKQDEDSSELRDLGEKLFYDPAISASGTMSCASCHNPEKAFTDGIPKSLSSMQGKTVLRNAPTLINAVYADRYFYDLRAFTLEQQAEHVIFNEDEFNTAYSSVLKKLAQDKAYAAQFKKVYGSGDISREKFSKALSSYVLSLRSFNSGFDKYVRGEQKEISPEVKNGFNLFMGKANCATCHFAPTFSGLVPPFYSENESEILGVLSEANAKVPKLDADEGRWANAINSEYAWIYEKSFKTTTVRNAGLTAPYFHNGAYATLEEVIDFYNEGGGEGKGLLVHNQTLPPDKLNLTDKEKRDLIAFINSLNDNPFDQNK